MVLGSGFMGSGIAQVCANGGFKTILWDLTEDLTKKAVEKIAAGLDARIAKGKDTEEHKQQLLANLFTTTDLSEAKEADLVIEVIIENEQIKLDTFKKLDGYLKEDAFVASNTSYLSITKLATALSKPERFVGMHFFGPVPAMKLLEIIRGEKTCDCAVEAAKEVAAAIGKTPVVVEKDTAGFIVNRLNAALRIEAYRIYEEGIGSIEDIDTACKMGLNHPMGPFELNDMSGIEIGLSGLDTLYKTSGEERWHAQGKARELVANKEFGRKTGKGWYIYENGTKITRDDL